MMHVACWECDAMYGNRDVVVRNLTKGTTIAARARMASSIVARGRGLMFVSELPKGAGLVIDPCSSIHMFWMRIPLDVLYVSKANVVVRVQRDIKPWRVGPLRTPGARYVVELPVGTIDTSATELNDVLEIAHRDAGLSHG
jgi:uncharacterized protein